jgi:hypothetical protein
MKRPLSLIRLLPLLALALTACSSFDAKWRAAETATGPNKPTRWEGRWTSAGHRLKDGTAEGGQLRAILTKTHQPAGSDLSTPAKHDDRALQADFHARWKIFSGSYTLTLTPVPGSRTDFQGTHDLPAIFGGTYRYTARIKGDKFTATYDSSYDRGNFDLTRVRP